MADRREREREREREMDGEKYRERERDKDVERDRDRERDKKSGFWGSLFRSRSVARKSGKLVFDFPSASSGSRDMLTEVQEKDQPRRSSEGDILLRRRRTDGGAAYEGRNPPRDRDRRRPRYSEPLATSSSPSQGASSKGKDPHDPRSPVVDRAPNQSHAPLTEWPPSGVSSEEELTPEHARGLISWGAPTHRGHVHDVPHCSGEFYRLFVTTSESKGDETDRTSIRDLGIYLMTLPLYGREHARQPWETLEQPSQSYWFGKLPGTVTLNQFISAASQVPDIPLRDPRMAIRDISLEGIFERLKDLEVLGLEEEDEGELYRTLYKTEGLLKDPEKYLSPHKTLERQITDLIQALSSPHWIDFTEPKNHVVTRYIFDRGHANHATYLKFFHQLLFSLELDLRIMAKQHGEVPKERLLKQLPPKIQWSIALARRWKKYVRIEKYGATAEQGELGLGFFTSHFLLPIFLSLLTTESSQIAIQTAKEAS